MPSYNCQYCRHEFRQKVDLDRHLNKKNGCIPVNKVISITSQTGEVHSIFKTCLDHLRNDAEHLVGDEALTELSRFIILKQIEQHIESGLIDIYDMNKYSKDTIKKYGTETFKEYLEYVKFSKFVEYVKTPEKEENIKNVYDKFLWASVLSNLKEFKEVFQQGKNTFIKESKTIKKIVITLSSIDFSKYDFDVLGEAYESVFVDAVFGAGKGSKSEFGQFFTPLKVKKLLVDLVNPQITYDDEKNPQIEVVFEPACGTGGILNTVIKHYHQFVKQGLIKDDQLREQLVKNIYGIEIKGKVFNLCLSNMLINTGVILPHVICADSIRQYHNVKANAIIANPPFSVSIPYGDLLSSLGGWNILNDYIPIEVTGANSEMLFLQMMIHCLHINGRCSTVMLDGSKMFGKNGGYSKVREYLMKSCDLREVILCPSGTFTSTGAKTCILFFTKKHERKDVLEIVGEDKKRRLKFCNEHATKKVKFYEFNPDTEQKYHLLDVDITTISENHYSLSYDDYMKKEERKREIIDDIEYKTLGEICDIEQGNSLTKKEMINGDYPVIGGGKIIGMHHEKNREGGDITLTRVGDVTVNYMKDPYYLTDNGFCLKSYTNFECTKYIYYFLLANLITLEKMYNGSAQKVISKTNIKTLPIPIPSLSHQQEIVDFLDQLYKDVKVTISDTTQYYGGDHDIFSLLLRKEYETFRELVKWQEQSVHLQLQIDFLKERNKRYIYLSGKGIEPKLLGEICDMSIKGDTNTNTITNTGEYPFYKASVSNPSGSHNKYCFDGDEYILFVKSGGNAKTPLSLTTGIGKVFLENGKSCGNTEVIKIISNNNELLTKYLFFILQSEQLNIQKLAHYSTNLGHIDMTKFKKFNIPIPSLSRQQEIVEYCEKNDKMISSLQKEIDENKAMASEFLKNALESYEEKNNNDDKNNNEEKEDKEEDENKNDEKPSQPSSTLLDLQQKSVSELKEMAKVKGIKGISKLKKEELIQHLVN